MIKFFRTIRQQLLSENKFSKYFIYALGEIILVVIGILIALELNNRNVKETNRKESTLFVMRLQKEIESNIISTQKEMRRKEHEINSSLAILNMFHEDIDKLSSHTLDSLLFICLGNTNMEFKVGTLNEGLNTGKVALIESDSLKSFLYGMPALIEKTRRLEDYNNGDINDYFFPFVYKHISFRKMDSRFSNYKDRIGPSKFKDHNNLEVLNSLEFESLMDNRFYNCNDQHRNYSGLKAELEKLNEMINNYLNKTS